MPYGPPHHGPPHHGPPHHGPPHHGPPLHRPHYPPHLYPPHLHPPHLTVVTPPLVVPMPTYNPPPPEPAPTYVTNYIYQPPVEPQPTPVQVVEHALPAAPPYEDYIDWVPSTPHTALNLSHRAVVAGKEPGFNASPLWVIRAHHNGDLVPGKLAVNDRRAYIPYNGTEVPVHNFEVLCAPSHMIRWLPSSNGNVPPGAIVGGNTASGETLYIGRANHLSLSDFGKFSVCPGKVHPSHGCLYISFSHVEVPHKQYEVLCRTVG